MTAQICCCEQDFVALSSVFPSISSWLGTTSQTTCTDGTSFTSQGTPVSICSAKSSLSEENAAGIPHFPWAGLGCKLARGARLAELSFVCPAEEEGGLCMVCICSVLELNRQFCVGPVYKGESCNQPCDKGMMKVQMGTLVSLLCLQISCVRGAVMWCKLWETSHIVLFIYSEASARQISSIFHVSPTWVRTLASLQTEWAWMLCTLLSK